MQCSRRRRETQCATCASGLASGTRTSPVGDRNGDFPVTEDPLRVLFVTPECAPWVKTGGLGDVAAALPAALITEGVDVRVLMPAYRGVPEQAGPARVVARLPATAEFPDADLYQSALPSGVPAYVLDCAALYDRAGRSLSGRRRSRLQRQRAALRPPRARRRPPGAAESPLAWQPDVLHCNDWQTGLAPAYLRHAITARAATLMTVHNLAFQGVFAGNLSGSLGLPAAAFSIDGIEYYGATSFLKAGLFHASALSTVSPTYAKEIQRAPLGCGLEGLLAGRSGVLHGILNGIDTDTWNPATDPLLACRYDADTLAHKAENKRALHRLGRRCACNASARRSEPPDPQKGSDLSPRLHLARAARAVIVQAAATGARARLRGCRAWDPAAPT